MRAVFDCRMPGVAIQWSERWALRCGFTEEIEISYKPGRISCGTLPDTSMRIIG